MTRPENEQFHYPPVYGGYQQGYSPYPYPPPRPTNGMAVAALVMIFVFPPLAIVFGVIAKKQIRLSGEDGDGMATAGVIAGSVLTAIGVLGTILFVIFFVALFHTIGDLPNTFPTDPVTFPAPPT